MRCCTRYFALALVVAAMAVQAAAQQTKEATVRPGLREVPVDNPDAQFIAISPPTLDMRTYRLASGGSTCVFIAETKHREIILYCYKPDYDNRTTSTTRYILRVRPDTPPDPDPDPDPVDPEPDLTGFPKEVYEQAKKINRPQDALDISNNFTTVKNQMEASQGMSVRQAKEKLDEYNRGLNLDPTWRPFGQWLGGQLNQKAQNRSAAIKVFGEIAEGLKAAG